LHTYFLFLHKAKEKLANYATIRLSKKTSFILILIFTIVVVFDTTIVDFSSYSGVEFATSQHIGIFIIFSMIFAIISTILLYIVRNIISTDPSQPAHPGFRYFQAIIIAVLIFTLGILLLIIFQMVLSNKYSLILLEIQTYISHLSALVFLSFLIFLFAGWLISRRNYRVAMYAIAFSLASISIVVSLIYLESYLSNSRFQQLPDVKPYALASFVTQLQGLPITESLSVVFDVLSISSFLLMWVATAIFLSQYRYKMGGIKYYSIMSIPLLYYVFPFQNYFGDMFFSLLQSSPVYYSISYILIFSATKQAGALLFSLAFWSASTLIYDNRVRKSLLISAIGMAMLFGSLEIEPLQYHTYPPYGLVTEAFIPLGTYLLFVGIFTSAKSISRDANIRREFYKTAESQLTLLKAIGVSEMEKELENQVKYLQKRAELLGPTEVPELEEEDVKEILHDVLNELYYSKSKKEIQKS
jgi:hypothetical protein